MNENITESFIKKAKHFREQCNFSEKNMDELLKEKKLTYTKLEYGKRTLTLDLAEAIAEIFGLTYCTFKELNQELPALEDLPVATRNKINEKAVKMKIVQKGTHNINENVIIVLSNYPVGEKFTNSKIIAQFPKDLANHMNNRSIEWGKGTLKGLVVDTKETVPSLTSGAQEKVYKLAKKIIPEVREKAQEKIYKNAILHKPEK